MKSRRILIKITLMVLCGILVNFVPKLNVTYAVSEKDDKKIKISMSKVIKDGVYYINCASNSNYVLDIENGSIDNTANLQIYQKKGNLNQKFYIHYVGNGYYKISNVSSAKTVEVKDASVEINANVQQMEDIGADCQKWKIRKNIDGTYNFINAKSEMALDVNDAKFENETNVMQYTYTNSYAQKFKLEETEFLNEGISAITRVDNSNVVWDINNATSKDGEQLEIFENNDTLAQRFEIHKVGKNEVRIRTAASGGWLKEKSSKDGAEVVQSGNSKTKISKSDTWKVEWNRGLVFINKESGLYLTIKDNSIENEAKIIVNKPNASSAQVFLVKDKNLIKDDWYELESGLGTVMDLNNFGSDWGTNIDTWIRNGQNNQKFNIIKKDNGYVIYTMHKLPLDVKDGSMDNGANIQQWEDNGANCQRWIPEIKDGGYIAFKNVNSGKYIDVANGSNASGANVQQYEASNSKAQMWKLTKTTCITGWVTMNGSQYCYDPQTGKLITNTTRLDPMMTDPAQYGAIYDFDSQGRASWHLPTLDDLSNGHGKNAPVPEIKEGDQRQRTLLLALSRVGCDYKLLQAPTGFVCDGLTAWCFSMTTGIRFRTTEQGSVGLDDQDMSWQYPYIKHKNGIKTDLSQIKSGDFMYWGDASQIENHETNGTRHASIYYHNGIMIHAASTTLGVTTGPLDSDLVGFGSPYDAETSRCEIHN